MTIILSNKIDMVKKATRSHNYQINGGTKLSGSITTKTSKNCALALVYAAIVSKQRNVLINTPKIEEIERTREIFHSIGVDTTWESNNLIIDSKPKINYEKLNKDAASKTRAMLYLLGVLPHFANEFSLPVPGGCKLGKRTISAPYYALCDMGFEFKFSAKDITVTLPKKLLSEKKDREIVMYEASDTGANIAILAALALPGTTTIRMTSSNYMIQDMCYGLISMGAKIEGIGTSTLKIYGNQNFKALNYPVLEDPIEGMMLIALAATTNSEFEIKGLPKDFLELELLKLEKMGFNYEVTKKYRSKSGNFDLLDIKTKKSKLEAPAEKIHAQAYPGLNMDNLPFFVPIATQAKGKTLIHDWVYENRALYYMEMQKLGADIILADPHRVYVTGKTELNGAEIVCPPALRPSVIILIGMIAAKGKSILRNTYSIDRGHEDLFNRLKEIGADIKEIE